MMELQLEGLPQELIRSAYRKGAPGFPGHMSFMHPKAADAFLAMQSASGWKIVLSDMWRASGVSLQRRKEGKRGVQPPAKSGHNFGFSIDIDVIRTMRAMKMSKKQLDKYMASFGFVCHRKDHRVSHECWHYNALVVGGEPDYWLQFSKWRFSTARAVEMMIRAEYSRFWAPSTEQKQQYLWQLKLYLGKIDGDFGPKSKRATRAFQHHYMLKVDGDAGPKTCRVLSFRCAEKKHGLLKELYSVKHSPL